MKMSFPLKVAGALSVIATLAFTGSLLGPAAARAQCAKTVAPSSAQGAMKAGADLVSTFSNKGDTCQTDPYQPIYDNSGATSEVTIVVQVSNSGECDLRIGDSTESDKLVNGKTTLVTPGSSDLPKRITVPAGHWLVATCSGGQGKCAWTIKVPVVPTVATVAPVDGAEYPVGKTVKAKYKCPKAVSCVGTVPNGQPVDTSTAGLHTFSVTAADRLGNERTLTVSYRVVYRFSGFFSPVTNTSTGKLNRVHAGDLTDLGFGLGGNEGLNILAQGSPQSQQIPCPQWPALAVPAGSQAGLRYDAASARYLFGWQTSQSWAGTCRRFTLVLADGKSMEHVADYQFVQ